MKKTEKQQITNTTYVVWLNTGQCITGFNQLPTEEPKDNEIKIAVSCYAIIGNEHPYQWDSRESAEFVASLIQDAKVEQWE